ncbi:MAG: GTP cyclohydrolase MptA [Halobacteriota archaeon]
MSKELPDVQASMPAVSVGLSQVGVTNVKKLVKLSRPGDLRPIILNATFDVLVDLPRWRKGADMSRNMEVIDEILEDAVRQETYRVEAVCGDAARRLLSKHDYTTQATVEMNAEYFIRERTPESGLQTQSTADIIARATATDEGTREEIGATVTGMTVCPCSQGMMADHARDVLVDLGVSEAVIEQFLERVPQAGHSQRGRATLTIECNRSPEVDLLDIIEVARDAMSARIYNLAKRPDEDHMTIHAHENAKFVEDCVRSMAEGVVERFPDLPDDAMVRMEQRNEESIHQHDAYAKQRVAMGRLREAVGHAGDAA